MPTTRILSGKEVSQAVYADLESRIQALKERGVIPGLAVVLVGNDPASHIYVRSKTRRFAKLQLVSETVLLPEDTSETDLLRKIDELNRDSRYHGILVQLPLPVQIAPDRILEALDPRKDVDGFHPANVGRLTMGNPRFIPCTPKGILRLLRYYDVDLDGKHVVVVGRSNIVGRPMSILTSLKRSGANATTTLCHTGTINLKAYTRQADVIIAASGVPQLIDETYIQPGVVIIDVGINRVNDDTEKGYHLVGDVNQERVMGIAAAITPVPGGVGPMTIAMLVENTVEAAERASS
jgi:methylenetetrahydrofolate dehydrogenase (NADP+)/methenyltetrahydrofolate cyclohydrolase